MAVSLQKIEAQLTVNNSQFQKGFAESQTRVKQFSRYAGKAEIANKNLSQSFRTAAQNIAAFQGPLGPVSGRLSSIASLLGTLNPLLVSTGLGFTALSAMAVASVKELDEYEVRLAKTEAIIRATGGAAGLTADQIAQLADDVALNTLASVQGVLDASNAMLTFKSVQGDTFKDAIKLSQDLSAVMGTDIKSSALQLGKAMEDPLTGLTALRRAGVSFTETQKDMIKEMVESGNLAKAQTYILAELATQIGGAGTAEANGSVAGAADTASQRWQELKRTFAETFKLKPAAKSFFETLAAGFDSLRKAINPTEKERLQEIATEIGEINGKLKHYNNQEHLNGRQKRIQKDLQNQLNKLRKEGHALQDITIAKIKEQQEAQQQANQQQQISQNEKLAENLQKQQTASVQTLNLLENQLADEEEKLNLSWERREKQIENLVLSEQQIKERGFESLAQLQDYYQQQNDLKMNEGFQKIEEKENRARERRLKAEQDEANRKLAIKKEVNDQIERQEIQLQNNLFAIGKHMAGENQKLMATVFVAEKAAAITRAYLNVSEGITKAEAMDPTGVLASKVAAVGYANIAAMSALSLMEAGSIYSGGGSSGSSSSISTSKYSDPVQQSYSSLTTQDSAARQEVVIQQSISIQALDGADVQRVVENNKDIFLSPIREEIEERGGLY